MPATQSVSTVCDSPPPVSFVKKLEQIQKSWDKPRLELYIKARPKLEHNLELPGPIVQIFV